MTPEQWADLIAMMEVSLVVLNERKKSEGVDGRALSIAATHLETALLWVEKAKR